MSFDYKAFVKEIQKQFKDDVGNDTVKELLDLNENYTKDSPVSTGKDLSITRLHFTGTKVSEEVSDYSNQPINFSQTIQPGINIWVADNLKGKSSLFKIIKYALTGKDSLKPNVKKWIKQILLNFKISAKEYTIYLNTEKRLKALLLNGTYKSVEEINSSMEEPLISASSETDYGTEIQNFFFTQFSYYPLKWTQKSSVKDSTDLLEVGASWATYFKAIFLESKDSSTLMFGDQGKKVFQMLLGLQLTYPINQLSVKKDLLNEKKGKQNLFSQMKTKKTEDDQEALQSQLNQLNNQLAEVASKTSQVVELNTLYVRYQDLLNQISERNRKALEAEQSSSLLHARNSSCSNKIYSIKQEIERLENEIEKNLRRITDINEYLAIGIFFSNLDIKQCPSCNTTLNEEKKRLELDQHKCALCTEPLTDSPSEDETSTFEAKIKNLTATNVEFEKEIVSLRSEQLNLEQELSLNNSMLSELSRPSVHQEDEQRSLTQLRQLEHQINEEKKNLMSATTDKDSLLQQKAIIEYRLSELKKDDATSVDEINYDKQIELLATAIQKLNTIRFELGQKVIKRLEELMLQEIHEFGLKSITEIKISSKDEIQYRQDGEFITFDDIAEGEQLRAKIAFYLSLIQLDIEYNFGKHPRFLMIDSPGKEEADANYLHGLSGVLKSIQDRLGDRLQILIGTAERGLSNIVENEYVTPQNTYVF